MRDLTGRVKSGAADTGAKRLGSASASIANVRAAADPQYDQPAIVDN